MALLDLTFDTIKFIVQRLKTNPSNIVFNKIPIGDHCGFSDDFWDYWVYDTWEDMDAIWHDYYSPVYPAEDEDRHYFDEEYM